MNSLNDLIATNDKFTAPPNGIPVTDHSAQMAYGMGYAQRSLDASKLPSAPLPEPMKPIQPVAN